MTRERPNFNNGADERDADKENELKLHKLVIDFYGDVPTQVREMAQRALNHLTTGEPIQEEE